ncbi:MAG TPA: ABC transporter substrate-binding protein [Streptosporangiaceae bacterium]|nr:ABC transporter substrate-binding protein [Streptosporangiaceae bacterium]
MDRSDRSSTPRPAEGLGRRQFLRGMAATGAVAGAAGLLGGCGGSSPGRSQQLAAASRKPRRGGGLKLGLTGGSSSDTIDPHKSLTYVDTSRLQSLYQPLVQLDAQAQIEYVLAESITAYHGSLAEWVIQLRPGVTFSNGQDFTSADVLFTFQRVYHNDFTGKFGLGPIDLAATRALGPHTVLVKLTKPFASFAEQLAAFWYNLYIAPTGFDPAHPAGTGAFVYQSFTPGQRSVFTRNPDYWKSGLPYVDTLTIIDFSDNTSLQDALTTGVIDGAGALDGPQIAALATTRGIRTVVSHSGEIIPFTMRVDQAPFSDVNVRQALRLLVDRPQLIDSALDGYGVVGNDLFSPYDPDFDHSLVRPAQGDVPQARFLLKKAGQENLTVTLTTSAVATGTVAMATVLAAQAKAAGVTVKLSNVPSGVFFGPNYLKWSFAQDYYNYYPYLAQVAESMLKGSPFNETHTSNANYTSLYNQANATADPALRKEIIYQMQQFDFTQGGYIIPAYIDVLDAYSDKVTGYTAGKVGQPLSNFDFEHFAFTG